MAEKKVEAEASEENAEASPGVGRFLYRLALAGVGGVVLAQEELSGLFLKKTGPQDAEAAEVAKVEATPTEQACNTSMEATIDRVLHTLNLPTRTDVEDLSQKIEALHARVEALRG